MTVVLLEPEVIAQAQAGCPAAFATLYEVFRAPITNHVAGMMSHGAVHGAEDAADFTADAFLKVWLALPHSRPNPHPKAFAGWIFQIASNVCRDALRHRKLMKWEPLDALPGDSPSLVAADHHASSPERACLAQELASEVRSVLDALPPHHRDALVLREFRELSYDEMAERLGTNRASVKCELVRARTAFRAKYDARQQRNGAARSRPLPDTCPLWVVATWSKRHTAWRYHVCISVLLPGQHGKQRRFGTYATVDEAEAVVRRMAPQLRPSEYMASHTDDLVAA